MGRVFSKKSDARFKGELVALRGPINSLLYGSGKNTTLPSVKRSGVSLMGFYLFSIFFCGSGFRRKKELFWRYTTRIKLDTRLVVLVLAHGVTTVSLVTSIFQMQMHNQRFLLYGSGLTWKKVP